MTPVILFPGRTITPFTAFVPALRVLAPSTAVPELFLTQPNGEISLCSQNPGRGELELAARSVWLFERRGYSSTTSTVLPPAGRFSLLPYSLMCGTGDRGHCSSRHQGVPGYQKGCLHIQLPLPPIHKLLLGYSTWKIIVLSLLL